MKLERQYKWFRKQIELAISKKLPLILHVRNAHPEAIAVLSEYAEDLQSQNAGVIHCFNGNLESAYRYIEMGFCLGIGGLITDTKNQALRNVVEEIPLSKIVLETDAPYVTPEGAEEKRNSSLNIPIIAQDFAAVKHNPACLTHKKHMGARSMAGWLSDEKCAKIFGLNFSIL